MNVGAMQNRTDKSWRWDPPASKLRKQIAQDGGSGRSAFSCILASIFPILWFCLRFWHNRDPTFKLYKLKLKVNKFDFQNKTCLENYGSYI